MRPVRQSKTLWALVDYEDKILHENLSWDDLLNVLTAFIRVEVAERCQKISYTDYWFTVLVKNGRVKCIDCGSPVTLASVNPNWPEDKQRCPVCRGL